MIRRETGVLGRSTILAVVALAALLAAGLGVLGGRPGRPQAAIDRSPGAASGATASSDDGTRSPDSTPLVTPATPCGPLPPDDPPGVMLRVGNHLMAAQVESDGEDPGTGAPDREPITVPADAVAHITIAAGRCALGWHIALWSPSDGELHPIDVVPNPDGDPQLAQQNQFDVIVAPLRDLPADVLELRAALRFPDRSVLARWPITIPPFPHPEPRLRVAGDLSLSMVEGCDVVLTFANGYEERHALCDGDLSADPAPAAHLPPGTEMALDFDGWSIGDTIGFCGAASERAFLLLSDPGCEQRPPHGQSFEAPRAGDWTMAIAACAIKSGNRICGTWYVNVDTR